MGSVQLGFSGGEPLTRKDLPELIRAARDLGFYTNPDHLRDRADGEQTGRLQRGRAGPYPD